MTNNTLADVTSFIMKVDMNKYKESLKRKLPSVATIRGVSRDGGNEDQDSGGDLDSSLKPLYGESKIKSSKNPNKNITSNKERIIGNLTSDLKHSNEHDKSANESKRLIDEDIQTSLQKEIELKVVTKRRMNLKKEITKTTSKTNTLVIESKPEKKTNSDTNNTFKVQKAEILKINTNVSNTFLFTPTKGKSMSPTSVTPPTKPKDILMNSTEKVTEIKNNPNATNAAIKAAPIPSPSIECWESPYIDCGTDPAGYVINTTYAKRFGPFKTVNIKPSLDHPSPGLSVSTSIIGADGKVFSSYRVSLFNKVAYTTDFVFTNCEFSNCEYAGAQTDSSVDLVVVNAVELNTRTPVPPRAPHQMYAAIGWESPAHYHNNILRSPNAWSQVFNFTATYRRDADMFAPYGKLKFVLPNPEINYVLVALAKTKTAVWIVSNCGTASKRRKFVTEMQKYIDVDIFGHCGRKCPSNPDLCGTEINRYRFYLSFENSICTDYITEKFFKNFEHGKTLVPVARGGGDYDAGFEPGSFINAAHFKTGRDLALHLKFLSENVNEYVKILETKMKYVSSGYHLNNFSCDMCKMLNKKDTHFTRQYNFPQWVGGCRPPADLGL